MTTTERTAPRWSSSAGAWGRFTAGLLARLYLCACLVMLAWTVLPALLGWHSYTILSGSMSPRIQPGDVVVASPVATDDVRRGMVVTFRNPAQPDPHRPKAVLTHRVAAVRPDGQLITRGDANQSDDSTPVPADDVLGLGRLRVPMVGLPLYWARTGQLAELAAWATFTAAAVAVVVLDRPTRPGRPGGSRRALWLAGTAPAVVVALVLVGAGSGAAFSGRSATRAGSWAAAADLSPAYVDAVLGTSPAPVEYLQLDEAAGTVALDDSTGAHNGQYASTGVTYGVAGPLSGGSSGAVAKARSTAVSAALYARSAASRSRSSRAKRSWNASSRVAIRPPPSGRRRLAAAPRRARTTRGRA